MIDAKGEAMPAEKTVSISLRRYTELLNYENQCLAMELGGADTTHWFDDDCNLEENSEEGSLKYYQEKDA